MAIVATDTRYECQGKAMHGRLFRDDGWNGDRACVLVLPEGFGISDHTYRQAERITALGYAALACDLFGEAYFFNGPHPETRARVDAILALPKGLLGIGAAALDHAKTLPGVDPQRIAAAGYCLGGTIAMEMAIARLPIRAALALHPSFAGLSLDDIGTLSCPMELFLGTEDYATPPPAREKLEAAFLGTGNRWRLTLYGGVRHDFTNPDCQGMGDKVAYDESADRHSFDEMARLLAEVLG